MMTWKEMEKIAQRIITPWLDEEGKATGRMAGTHHLFDLMTLLKENNVLVDAGVRLSHLTMIIQPDQRYDARIAIVPPGPNLSGSVDEFIVATQRRNSDGYRTLKEINIHYSQMHEIVQFVEENYPKL